MSVHRTEPVLDSMADRIGYNTGQSVHVYGNMSSCFPWFSSVIGSQYSKDSFVFVFHNVVKIFSEAQSIVFEKVNYAIAVAFSLAFLFACTVIKASNNRNSFLSKAES